MGPFDALTGHFGGGSRPRQNWIPGRAPGTTMPEQGWWEGTEICHTGTSAWKALFEQLLADPAPLIYLRADIGLVKTTWTLVEAVGLSLLRKRGKSKRVRRGRDQINFCPFPTPPPPITPTIQRRPPHKLGLGGPGTHLALSIRKQTVTRACLAKGANDKLAALHKKLLEVANEG